MKGLQQELLHAYNLVATAESEDGSLGKASEKAKANEGDLIVSQVYLVWYRLRGFDSWFSPQKPANTAQTVWLRHSWFSPLEPTTTHSK